MEGASTLPSIMEVLEGQEYVEVSHIEYLSNLTDYDSEHDIQFGDVAAHHSFKGYLEPGCFLVCFPEDTHLVGAHESIEQAVKKIVYKIEV
jgi:biofilm protein TabA